MSTWRVIRRAALLIGLLAGACATPDGARSEGPEPGEDEAAQESGEEIRLQLARLRLDLAGLEAAGEMEAARADLEEAHRPLEHARADLGLFDGGTAPIRLQQAQLELDESAFEVAQSEAALKEILAMYAEEEFAELTVELVVERHEKELEFARRTYEIGKAELEHLKVAELPQERRELEETVRSAERALIEATRAAKLAELQAEISMAEAREELREIEEEEEEEE